MYGPRIVETLRRNSKCEANGDRAHGKKVEGKDCVCVCVCVLSSRFWLAMPGLVTWALLPGFGPSHTRVI